MAWEWPASATCLPNGPGSTRCSDFLRGSSAFEPRLCARGSLFPGNGISRPETKPPKRPPNYRAAVAETERAAATLAGRLPHGMGVARLADMPAEWSRQHQMLGLPPA